MALDTAQTMPDLPTALAVLAPELLVGISALALLVLEIRGSSPRGARTLLALMGLAAGALATTPGWTAGEATLLWGGVFVSDRLSLFFRAMACLVTLVFLLLVRDRLEEERHGGDFLLLAMFITLGLMLATAAGEFLTFFVAFELLSIPSYVLAAWGRRDPRSSEAGLKYFVTGAVSSAVLLYGISLVYGTLGTTFFHRFAERFDRLADPPQALLLGAIFVLAALAFKVAAVPFHMWAPDVYEGAPTPVGAFVSSAPKAAIVAVLLRLYWGTFDLQSTEFLLPQDWTRLFAVLAALSMTVGNLVALVQQNLKRLMAYSGIAHIGYVFLGLAAAGRDAAAELGAAAAVFYVFLYAFTNLAAWGVILEREKRGGSHALQAYAGLARRSPFLALVLMLSFMSLAGVPPLAGFLGKFFLFRAAWEGGMAWLVALAVVNSVISLYYYFGVLQVAYFQEPADPAPLVPGPSARLGFALCLAVIAGLGFVPGMTEWALGGAAAVFAMP